MFGFGKKPKASLEISWPVESSRDVYAHAPRREALSPPIPTRSETSSTRSVHSPSSSHSSYFSNHSIDEHDQHTPVISIPPRTYMMAESSQIRSFSLPLHAPHARPTTSSTKDSRLSPTSSRSSQPSYASSNTMYTVRRGSAAAGTVSSCDDGSCQLDDLESEQMFEQFQDQIHVSDNLPDANAMEAAGDIPIFDSAGNSRPFRSIYSGDLAIGKQQMVLFVRHFFCGVSSLPPLIATWASHTNPLTGMSSIHQSSLQEYHSTNLLHPTHPNFNHHHRSRFTETHRLLSQSDWHSIPNLRRSHQEAIQSTGHELDSPHWTTGRLYERHKRIPMDKRPIRTSPRRTTRSPRKRWKHFLGRRRIHVQRRKTSLVSSHEEF